MSDTSDLAQVLADARGDAAVLRRAGNAGQAEYVEGLCRKVAEAAEEWLLWLSEGDAAVRCGRSDGWLRARFPALQRDGHARLVGRARQYRACAIPRRANITSAAARGRAAARAVREQRKSA